MHVKGKFAVCMNSSWFCIILVLGTFVANPANGYSFHTLLQQLALLEELKPRNPIIFCHSTALACAFLSGWCSASTTTTGEPSPTNAAEHIAGGDLERKRLPLQNSAKQEAKPCDGHRLQLGPAMCKGAASALRFLYLLICLLCLFHIAFLLPECPHLIRFLCRPLGWLNLGGGSSVGVGSHLLFWQPSPKATSSGTEERNLKKIMWSNLCAVWLLCPPITVVSTKVSVSSSVAFRHGCSLALSFT